MTTLLDMMVDLENPWLQSAYVAQPEKTKAEQEALGLAIPGAGGSYAIDPEAYYPDAAVPAGGDQWVPGWASGIMAGTGGGTGGAQDPLPYDPSGYPYGGGAESGPGIGALGEGGSASMASDAIPGFNVDYSDVLGFTDSDTSVLGAILGFLGLANPATAALSIAGKVGKGIAEGLAGGVDTGMQGGIPAAQAAAHAHALNEAMAENAYGGGYAGYGFGDSMSLGEALGILGAMGAGMGDAGFGGDLGAMGAAPGVGII